MAFLKLNGWAIPIANGSSECRLVEAGASGRTARNTFFKHRYGQPKRQWTFQTTPMSAADSHALQGLLSQAGDQWRFLRSTVPVEESVAATHYSQKGRYNNATLVSSVLADVAADSAPMYVSNSTNSFLVARSTGFANFPGAVTGYATSTNLLSTNEAHPTTGAHWSAATGGATTATDTTRFFTGSSSARVTFSNNITTEYVEVNAACSASTKYYGSLWFRPSTAAGEVLTVQLYDNVGGIGAASTQEAVAKTTKDGWNYLFVSKTTAVAASTITMRIGYSVDPGTGGTCNIDGLQIEAQSSSATPWQSGGASRGTTAIQYPNPLPSNATEATIGAWIAHRLYGTVANFQCVVGLGNSLSVGGTGVFALYVGPSNEIYSEVVAYDIEGASSISRYTVSSGVISAGWRFIAATYSTVTETINLYVDGVLSNTTPVAWSGTRRANPSNMVNMSIGNSLVGSYPHFCPIAMPFVLPYAASANQILGMYDSASATRQAVGVYPIYAEGDFLRGAAAVTVHANVEAIANHEQTITNSSGVASWANNAASIRFTLEEV